MRIGIIAISVLALSGCMSDADIRKAAYDPVYPVLPGITLPGLDTSDAGVIKSARGICLTQVDQCINDYMNARNRLAQVTTKSATSSATQRFMATALRKETSEGLTNWLYASQRFAGETPHGTSDGTNTERATLRAPRGTPLIDVECRTYSRNGYARTVCR